jgi:hypothetical protein
MQGDPMLRLIACASGLALAVAGAAAADPLREAVRPGAKPSAEAARDLAAAAFAPLPEAERLRRAGIAKTSLDYAGPADGVTGSLGFLCGLKPGAERTGAATARGYDPHGRFVGAKLSFAFR